jgi:hypothetical protein
MSVDSYLELTTLLGVKKEKKLPLKQLEENVYEIINKEISTLIDKI